MRPDHDIVIVGGGPAGLAAALFLARHAPALAARTLVVERERYPREKVCAGAIGARAERALEAIGVHVDVPGARFDGALVTTGRGSVEARVGDVGRVVRRVEYDARLAEVARARGVSIAEGVTVTGLETEDPGGGVVLRTTAGPLRARAVVGADGVGSFVRRALGLRAARWRAQVVETDTAPIARDLDRSLLHFDISDPTLSGYVWHFPTIVDGQPLVCRGVYRLLLPGERASEGDVGDRLDALLAARGLDPAEYAQKRFAERGFHPHEPIARGRTLLVGEAAGIDPVSGEGIAQAILYGRAAASYLAARLESPAPSFDDWAPYLRRTSLGRDLYVRHAIGRRLFGPARPSYERALCEVPGLADLALRYFGGLDVGRPALARLGARLARHLWRERADRPLRPAPSL
ncbi:MAG: NAD(P)/FAD-dependent oxidoreductase [Polyangiaceae bacterium]|nr:NAD(P)/FAD-dependent oxidoreductase [Polyangiaceae bacterium]